MAILCLDYLSSLKSKFSMQIKRAYEYSQLEIEPDNTNYIEKKTLSLLEEILGNVVSSDQRIEDEIMNIIYEEIPAFYIGDKTASVVTDIIGNRVLLYLKENE